MQSYECDCVNPNATIDDWDEITKNINEEGFNESHDWIFNTGDQSYIFEDEYPEDTCWWVFTEQDLDEEAHTPEAAKEELNKYRIHREEIIEIKYTTEFNSHEISCDKRYNNIEEGYDNVIISKVEKHDHLYTLYIKEEADRFSISTDCYWANMPISLYTRSKTTNEIYKTIDTMFSRSLLKEYKGIPLNIMKKAIGLSNEDGPKIISLI